MTQNYTVQYITQETICKNGIHLSPKASNAKMPVSILSAHRVFLSYVQQYKYLRCFLVNLQETTTNNSASPDYK